MSHQGVQQLGQQPQHQKIQTSLHVGLSAAKVDVVAGHFGAIRKHSWSATTRTTPEMQKWTLPHVSVLCCMSLRSYCARHASRDAKVDFAACLFGIIVLDMLPSLARAGQSAQARVNRAEVSVVLSAFRVFRVSLAFSTSCHCWDVWGHSTGLLRHGQLSPHDLSLPRSKLSTRRSPRRRLFTRRSPRRRLFPRRSPRRRLFPRRFQLP